MDVFQHIDALRKGQLAKAITPALPDWRSLIKEHGPAGEHHLVLAKGIVDDVDPYELASHLVYWNGPLFVDVLDTAKSRTALSKVGKPFTYPDELSKGRLFLASFVVEGALPITQTAKAVVESIIKPFAGYADFDACVLGMKDKGYSDDVAKKICGKLQAQTEKTKKAAYDVTLLTKAEDEVPEEERIVFGIVLQPEMVDSQGDIYSADEIKKACYLFMEQFGHFKIQHKGEFVDGALVTLENYILKEDWKTINAFGQEKIVKAGTWLHGARVNSDDLWNEIKEGKFTGWSIGGWSRQEPLE